MESLKKFENQNLYDDIKCSLKGNVISLIDKDVLVFEENCFIATYNVTDNSVSTRLYNNIYGNVNIYKMYIDDVEVTPTSAYTFSTVGEHKVKCTFCDNLKTGYGLFTQCSGLTSLDLSKLDTSEVTDMSYMFQYCVNLTSLDLSNFNTSKVTTMNSMFFNCKSLKTIKFGSNFNTSNITSMFCMFTNCKELESLDVSNFDTSKTTSLNCMFASCEKLETLDVSKWNTSNVTDSGGIFGRCISLKSLDVSKWNTSKFTRCDSNFSISNGTSTEGYGVGMFNLCENLTSLDLSNWDFSSMNNTNYMFGGCSKLTYIKMIGDVSNISVVQGMFSGVAANGHIDYNCKYSDKFNSLILSNWYSNFPSSWTKSCETY